MDKYDLEFLNYLAGGPATLAPLAKRIPQSTVYRIKDRFERRGWIVKQGTKYQLTAAGREAREDSLKAPAPVADPVETMKKRIPHLRMAPTPVAGK